MDNVRDLNSSGEHDIPFNEISEKTPILEDLSQKNRIRPKLRCFCFVVLVMFTVTTVAFVLWQHYYCYNDDDSDPMYPPPPSYMPMGLYKKVAAVSNGGPCSQIAVDIISKGGNAVDGAIALMLCDGVTCPQYMGVGGGFIMSIYNSTTKKVMAINARETAPAAATTGMFVNDPEKSAYGGLAIGIPGALKGYSTIYKLYGGGVPWEALFEPTIRLCEDGIGISKFLDRGLIKNEELIKKDPLLRDILIDKKTGQVKQSGQYYALPELAKTFKIIAKEGVDAIYNGSLTDQLIEDLNKLNSIITKEDLANYEVEVEESFSVDLKSGYTIHSGSPPGSGIVLAFILRVLDGLLPAPSPGLDAHRIVEAFKFGYGERSHLGDHKFVNVSGFYEKVNSDIYIADVQNKIFDNFTSPHPSYYGADFYEPDDHGTANMAVADSLGNVVVSTSTINTYLGCGRTSQSTGIIFNNQMDDFSSPGFSNYYNIPPSPSNFIKPGKRPMSSTCPTVFTDKNGDFVLGVGAAGGSKITLATSQNPSVAISISDLLDLTRDVSASKLWFNKTIKEAIDKPRIYHQLMPMVVDYEYGVTKDVIQTLRDIGHTVNRLKPSQSGPGSAATGIAKSPTGMLEAIADFRRTGNSSGY